MSIYKHSGCLGDIIYSLPVIQKLGAGKLLLVEGGVPAAIRKYNNGPVPEAYETKLSKKEIDMLAPLLLAQPYIMELESTADLACSADVDLDRFRATAGQSFTGNFLATYFSTFDIPYTDADIVMPWLTVPNPKHIAANVISRTLRYRSSKTSTIPVWLDLLRSNDVIGNAVFLGLPDEHKDFEETFNVKVPLHVCADFLEMAEIIAGCDRYYGNQTFSYGIAQGLGKPTVLETLTWRPLHQNECYFPRPECWYF